MEGRICLGKHFEEDFLSGDNAWDKYGTNLPFEEAEQRKCDLVM